MFSTIVFTGGGMSESQAEWATTGTIAANAAATAIASTRIEHWGRRRLLIGANAATTVMLVLFAATILVGQRWPTWRPAMIDAGIVMIMLYSLAYR